jgi:sulfite reductase alpha subunit-like flavoprotein
LQLGAKAVVPRGDGDDQHYLGLDGGLEPWLENLWSVVLKKWPLPPGVTVRSESELAPPSFNISIADEDYQEMNGIKLHSASKSQKEFRAQVLENIRLTAQEHFQDIRHLELRISDPSSSTQEARIYETGDVLVVRPLNDPEKVDQFLDLVGWTDIADKKLRVEPSHSDFALPSHCHSSSPHTLRSLCIQYLDICGKPKRYFFHLISHFCESEEHKERLQELSSSQGQQDLFRYAYSTKRTLLEVLMDFPLKGKIPLTYVLDLIPWIRPRSFSIASSPEIDPWRIGLTVGIVEYTVPGMKSLRTGVCTQWMKRLEVGGILFQNFLFSNQLFTQFWSMM